MQHLNVRLAQANGVNAKLCHMAKDRIMLLERRCEKLDELVAIHVDPTGLDEEDQKAIMMAYGRWEQREEKGKRWNNEESMRK